MVSNFESFNGFKFDKVSNVKHSRKDNRSVYSVNAYLFINNLIRYKFNFVEVCGSKILYIFKETFYLKEGKKRLHRVTMLGSYFFYTKRVDDSIRIVIDLISGRDCLRAILKKYQGRKQYELR